MTIEESKPHYGDLHQPFIGKIQLKGFKSIKDAEIEFKSGLNILIGPNGSGKTNLLDFLIDLGNVGKIKTPHSCAVNYFDWRGKNWFYSKQTQPFTSSNLNLIPSQKIVETLKKGEEIIADDKAYNLNEETIVEYEKDINQIFRFTKINYEIPKNPICLTEAYSVQLDIDRKTKGFNFNHKDFEINSHFSFNLYFKTTNHLGFFFIKNYQSISKETLTAENFLKNTFLYLGSIIEDLEKYTPIKNIKIDDDVSIKEKKETDKTIIDIKYLRFSFLVDDEWISWDMLSDGTKRMFYIIFLLSDNELSTKYLIEEPELGIHPHQLSLLMTFLKEKSEDNQIIITTHSPQVLNILKKDELERIIITKNEKQKGTTLRNLSDRELKKAKSFMEEDGLSLSDYWIHSDLEEQIL